LQTFFKSVKVLRNEFVGKVDRSTHISISEFLNVNSNTYNTPHRNSIGIIEKSPPRRKVGEQN